MEVCECGSKEHPWGECEVTKCAVWGGYLEAASQIRSVVSMRPDKALLCAYRVCERERESGKDSKEGI